MYCIYNKNMQYTLIPLYIAFGPFFICFSLFGKKFVPPPYFSSLRYAVENVRRSAALHIFNGVICMMFTLHTMTKLVFHSDII